MYLQRFVLLTTLIAFVSGCTTTEYVGVNSPLPTSLTGTEVKYAIKPNCFEKKTSKIVAINGDNIALENGDDFDKKESCQIQYQKTQVNPFWYVGQTLIIIIGLPLIIIGGLASIGNSRG